MTLEVVCADLFDVLSGLEPESVSAIVCDPPYGLHDWTPPRAGATLPA